MKSYWIESINFPKFSPLNKNITCDVCIVGGGITGITLAYLLSKKNIKVALLEKDRLACSTTGNTTAKITISTIIIKELCIFNYNSFYYICYLFTVIYYIF